MLALKNTQQQHVIEEELVDAVAQEHFNYIANGPSPTSLGRDGLSVLSPEAHMKQRRQQRRRQLTEWGRVAAGVLAVTVTLWFSRRVKTALVEIVKDAISPTSEDGLGEGGGGTEIVTE